METTKITYFGPVVYYKFNHGQQNHKEIKSFVAHLIFTKTTSTMRYYPDIKVDFNEKKIEISCSENLPHEKLVLFEGKISLQTSREIIQWIKDNELTRVFGDENAPRIAIPFLEILVWDALMAEISHPYSKQLILEI